ncbi:hypothetical protein [Nocardia salmonicida]|uniref:hypothetical protein n=1 Tax=Nocardia salmonicida TaxID=53431 RepID=UPI0037B0C012
MIRQENVDLLADHSILLAIPAFLPAIALVGVVLFIALRDRRSEKREKEGTESAPTDSTEEIP